MSKRHTHYILLGALACIACGVVIFQKLPVIYSSIEYSGSEGVIPSSLEEKKGIDKKQIEITPANTSQIPQADESISITHIPTPEYVRAIYVSSWVASASTYRNPLIKLIDDTELNAIVIDVKDSTGRIGFYMNDPILQEYAKGSMENRVRDMRALTNLLHSKNIYIIGRISVFQDPYMTKIRPEWAVTKKSDGTVWKDNKGLSFLDPANKEVWKYTVAIARAAYESGFDEINFDYIRYPSDGKISDINYHITPPNTRSDNLEAFFTYLHSEMKKSPAITTSADVFGLTTEAMDDMGIGQIWEKAIPHFDFIAPMVYPSHYPNGHAGYKNPAAYPYEIITRAIAGAILKTTKINQDVNKIRPWLQDFNLGATYTKDLVRAQIKAVHDQKLSSWMLWDPRNKYTAGALLVEN
jgi:hypothetical protein